MDFTLYFRLILKWLWLMVLGAVIAGGVGYATSSDPQVNYYAETLVLIGRYVDSPNPDTRAIQLGQSLAATYEQVIRTEAVIKSATSVLGSDISVGTVRGMLETYLIEGTSILVVRITSSDRQLALDLSRALAEQLIIASPTNLTRQESLQVSLAETEIEALSQQLEEARATVELLDQQIAESEDEETVLRLTTRRNVLNEQINQASANLAQFSSTIVNIDQRTNELEIIDASRVSKRTEGMGRSNTGLVAAFAGLVLAGGVAIMIEYADSTIKSADEVESLLETPVLGVVKKNGRSNEPLQQKLVMDNPQLSLVVEGYRTIRTNLIYGLGGNRKDVFAVLSPQSDEGRTVTAANLAAAISLENLRVLLIDADMRNPAVHEVFGVSNEIGLTTLIEYAPEMYDNLKKNCLPDEIAACVQETATPGLFVLAAGQPTTFQTEIASSERLVEWISILINVCGFEYVLIDTPPALSVVDGPALAATVGAKAVLVVDVNRTTRNDAVKVRKHLDYLGVETVGAVLNRTR